MTMTEASSHPSYYSHASPGSHDGGHAAVPNAHQSLSAWALEQGMVAELLPQPVGMQLAEAGLSARAKRPG